MSVNAYPLEWPVGRPRWSGPRQFSQFKMTESAMKDHLFSELDRMGASDVVVSTNRAPYSRASKMEDPGVAVYFKRKGQDICIACDKYVSVADNLHAIGLAIEAFRSIERHGTGEMVDRAFTGFAALPETVVGQPARKAWHEVLGVSPDAPSTVVEAAYRAMRKTTHPDAGGSEAAFNEVERAWTEVPR